MQKIGEHLKVMQDMLKFKCKLLLGFFMILGLGCNSENPNLKRKLVVLNPRKDTLCVLESDNKDAIVLTKCPIIRKSVSYPSDSTKITTIIVKDNEAPVIKTLGSEK